MFISYVHQLCASAMFISYVHQLCPSVMFISQFISQNVTNFNKFWNLNVSKPILSEHVFISQVHQPVHQQCSSKLFISLYLSQNSTPFNQTWNLCSSKAIPIKHEYIKHFHQLCSSARLISKVHQPIYQPKLNQF